MYKKQLWKEEDYKCFDGDENEWMEITPKVVKLN